MLTSDNNERIEDLKQNTKTHIRNIFSEHSYISCKFYNQYLSLSFYPEIGRNQFNKPTWGSPYEVRLTHEEAIQFIEAIKLMTNDPLHPINICTTVARDSCILTLKTQKTPDGKYTASFNLETTTKGNIQFEFYYRNVNCEDPDSGEMRQVQIQTQLIEFMRICQSYVDGINSDRHLNKMTDDFAKIQEAKRAKENAQGQNNNHNNQKNNWNQSKWKGNNPNNRWSGTRYNQG